MTTGTVRRLKQLVAVLVLSNVMLGVFSVYLLRQLDQSYSQLIDQTLPLTGELRSIGRENLNAYRALVTGLVENDAEKCAEATREAQAALARSKSTRERLMKSEILREKADWLNEFAVASEGYSSVVAELIPRLRPESSADSEKLRIARLQAALERCRAVQHRLIDHVEARSQALSDGFSAEVRSRTFMVLGVATWPVLLAAVLVAITVVIVVGMLFMYRQAGAGEGP